MGGVGVGEVGGYYSLKRLLCNLVTMVYSDIISNTLLLASGLPSCIIVGEFKMLEKKLIKIKSLTFIDFKVFLIKTAMFCFNFPHFW